MSLLFCKGLSFTYIPQVERKGLTYKTINSEGKVCFTTSDFSQVKRITAGCNLAELTLQRTGTHIRSKLNH